MEYNYKDIESVMSFKTWSDRRKIDELLRIDTYMYTNLGSDSTKKDKEAVKRKSKEIYRVINKIDPLIGSPLIKNVD